MDPNNEAQAFQDLQDLARQHQELTEQLAEASTRKDSARRAARKAEQKLRSLVPDNPPAQHAISWFRARIHHVAFYQREVDRILEELWALETLIDQTED